MKAWHIFGNLPAFAWALAFAFSTVVYADDSVVTLKLPTGTLTSYNSENAKEYRSHLTWKSESDQQEVTVSDSHGPVGMNPHLTLEAGFATSDGIAVLRGNAGGHLECWRFAKVGGSWNLHSKALIGSPAPDWRGVTFRSLSEFTVKKENARPDEFEVSKQQRSEHPVYRAVLKNGKVFAPEGTWIGTEVNDSPPNASAKAVPAVAPPSAPAFQDVTPTGHLRKTSQTKPAMSSPSDESSSSTPWIIIVVLIVAAIGLLWLLVKNRK